MYCSSCKKEYPQVEDIIIAIEDHDDFYKYNLKLKRFFKKAFENEKNSDNS